MTHFSPPRSAASESEPPQFTVDHTWWLQWSGRVDEWHAFEKEWDLGRPVGYGATEAAAIADLLEQLEEEDG